MLTIRAMTGAKGYAERHLTYSDYLDEDAKVKGQWRGQAAEKLGLTGEIKFEDFERLRECEHPATGEFLRQRRSEINFFDLTFSAPKSVSVMAILGEDRRLVDAHQRAVGEALREMETVAAARVRRGGANEDRRTGNMTVTVYHHDTSRELA